MAEAHTESGEGSFDHGVFDRLLRQHVSAPGFVDYEELAADAHILDTYLESIAGVDFAALSRDEKLALLINTYNAATLQLVLDHLPLASIKNIPTRDRWKARRWNIGGTIFSLEEIENNELRSKFIDPRIHFAINCASLGCPKLRCAAFTGPDIHVELDAHTRDVHADPRWARVTGRRMDLTKIYRWYEGDFVQAAGSVSGWAADYVPDAPEPASIGWLPYGWALNAARLPVGPARRSGS
jgi:hypothetical protein